MSNVDKDTMAAKGGSKPPFVHRTDLLITAVILAICAFLYWQTTIFAAPPSILGDYMLPQEFPRLLIYAIGLLALLLPFERAVLAKRGLGLDGDRSGRVQPIAYVTAAFMFAIVLMTPQLGTLITVLLIGAIMPYLWGERRYLLLALFAILVTASVYVLFEMIFRVRLVPGLLSPLYY